MYYYIKIMKKFLLIILILVLLVLIYNYTKRENFTTNEFTIDKIGFGNLNTYTPMKCNINSDESPSIVNITNHNYSSCFVDENKDKYIEIDKDNNRCNIYNNLNCTEANDGAILNDLTTPQKVLFRLKSRELLMLPQQHEELNGSTGATTTTGVITPMINEYINLLYVNPDNFKGSNEQINTFCDFLNDSKHINLDDYFCCLVEHLFVIRLIPTSQSRHPNNILNKLESLNLSNIIKQLHILVKGYSGFDINNLNNYFIKLENKTNPEKDYLLCYNIQVLKVALLYYIIHNIKLDNYYSKYNSSYITYLYNSFKRGHKIWGDYFGKCVDKLNMSHEIKIVLKKIVIDYLFSNQNNENIYKLFIYTSALISNENLRYYNDTTESNVDLISYNSNNRINPINNLENNSYVFYYSNEVVDTNSFCSNNKDETSCNSMSAYGCKFNSETNKCTGEFKNKSCMQISDSETCNENSNCEYDTDKNVCKPKTCFGSLNGEPECAQHKHCENIKNIELGGQIFNQCYDNTRIIRNIGVNSNDNFYDKTININDKCINKIYDNQDQTKRLSDNKIINNCKDGCVLSTHNDTKTCIKPNFINETNFFDNNFCRDIKNQFNCDFTPSCFWENNNCYPNSLGDDTMKCSDFDSNERCPQNKCVWYENKCHDIYDINRNNANIKTHTQPKTQPEDPSNNFEIKNVNCLAINKNPDNIDKMGECLYNNCHWQNERNLCVDKINKGCLVKSDNECANPQLNFNPLLNRNMCKLITDQNKSNIDESNDSKSICVDSEFKIPCNFYTKKDCPTNENPKVNLQGEIIEQPYCKISNDGSKCVEKDNSNNSCMYEYLKEGAKQNNYSQNCREIELSIPNNTSTKKVTMSINKQNLPCSLLDTNNCLFNGNGDICNLNNGNCKTNKDEKILYNKLDDVINDMSFANYEEITDRIGSIYAKQRSSKLCRLEDQIHGTILSINTNVIRTNNNLDDISIVNNFILFFVHLNMGDLIEIFNIDTTVPSFNQQKIELNNLLENINVIIKNRIELKQKGFDEDNKEIWISNKYKITNIRKTEREFILDGKLTHRIENTPIITKLGNIIITERENIERTNSVPPNIYVPYQKFVKWFIPNPMANLEDCLNDIKFKNMDRERYFNI